MSIKKGIFVTNPVLAHPFGIRLDPLAFLHGPSGGMWYVEVGKGYYCMWRRVRFGMDVGRVIVVERIRINIRIRKTSTLECYQMSKCASYSGEEGHGDDSGESLYMVRWSACM